jgi:hypothetical protein
MLFSEAVKSFSDQPLTKDLMLSILKDYKRPYDKIHELMKEGQLQLVKRGVYQVGPALNYAKPSPFLLANHILGPSYISMESALSYWGLIPEQVFEISSVTIKPSKKYRTPVGRFDFVQLPLPYYSFGIKQVVLSESQTVMMASPEKALCDFLVIKSGLILRSQKQVIDWVLKDLRISNEDFQKLQVKEIESWLPFAPKKSSMEQICKTIYAL